MAISSIFWRENTETASVEQARGALVKKLTGDIINQLSEQTKPLAIAK